MVLEKMTYHARAMLKERSLSSAMARIALVAHRRSLTPKALSRLLQGFALREYHWNVEPHVKPHLPRMNDVFVDIGANVGQYSLYMAPRCKAVYAFEPNPKTSEILRYRVRRQRNVHVIEVALGERTEEGFLFLHRSPGHDSLVRRHDDYVGKRIKIPVRSLDSFNFPYRLGLIKIDAEGYEPEVLRGASSTILDHAPRIIAEIHENREAVEKELKELDYHTEILRSVTIHNPHILAWP